jgi:hypothetical protein
MTDAEFAEQMKAQCKPDPPPDILYEHCTLSQFCQKTFQLDPIVQNVLVQEQPMMIGGPPKVLKSTIGLDLVISVATGRPFLNRFPVLKRLPVAFMQREGGPANLQETVKRICAAKAIDPASVTDLHISTNLPNIEDPKHHAAIRYFLKTTGAKVLFLDNAYLCMSGDDWSNVAKIGGKLLIAKDIAAEFGATLVYTHHTRKTLVDPHKPLDIQDASGAGFGEFAGQWVMLSRRREYVLGSGKHQLHMALGNRIGDSGLWAPNIDEGRRTDAPGRKYEVDLQSAAEATENDAEVKRCTRLTANVKKVQDALSNPNCNGTKKSIRDACGVQGESLDDALACLLQGGTIVETNVLNKNNNQMYEGYTLTVNHSD